MALLVFLVLLICGNAANGQFERMFQQNIMDKPPDTGKILIQSELKTETLVSVHVKYPLPGLIHIFSELKFVRIYSFG